MGFNLEKLLIDVFDPQKDETVLVMCDIPHDDIEPNANWWQRLEMAEEWQKAFEKLGEQIGFGVYPLLRYPATGAHSAPLPKFGKMGDEEIIIEEILKKANICVALTEYSATAPLIGFAKELKTLRVASMPRASKAMEKTALAADYKEVARKCSILEPKLTRADGALVYFSSGHVFYFDLRNRVAEEDNGMCHRDKIETGFPIINLPSGEVCAAPYEGEDEEIGVSKTLGFIPVKYGEELVVYYVEENKIVEVRGEGPEAKKMREYFAKDKGRRNIAELGLGCNNKAVLSGTVIEDEKVGFHWAYGLSSHIGGKTGLADFENSENAVHQDIIYAKGSPIEIRILIFEYSDGSEEEIIRDGEYLIF